MTTHPFLVHPETGRRKRIETDASGGAIAGQITQLMDDGQWHPMAFYSRKFIPAERNYEVHDQELLAVVESLRHWRHYLEGQGEFEVWVDHANLKYFIITTVLSRRQVRWAQYLSAFNFRIVYRKGSENPADAPSRRPDYMRDEDGDEIMQEAGRTLRLQLRPKAPQALEKGESEPHNRVLTAKQQKAQEENRREGQEATELDFGFLAGKTYNATVATTRARKILTEGTQDVDIAIAREHSNEATEEETLYHESLGMTLAEKLPIFLNIDPLAKKIRDGLAQETPEEHVRSTLTHWTQGHGLLFFRGKTYIPDCETLRRGILEKNHDSLYAGHFAIERTYDLLCRKFYWPTMKKDVREYCDSCAVCQGSRVYRGKQAGLLQPLPAAKRLNERIAVDFITGLPDSKGYDGVAYNAIAQVNDAFSKRIICWPTWKDLTAAQFMTQLEANWIKHHGPPGAIVSDRGPQFVAEVFAEILLRIGVQQRLSTAFHPQTDGQTERNNSTIEQYLRMFCNYEQNDWVRLLPIAEFVYNRTKHASTGKAPFELIYSADNVPDIWFRDREDAGLEGLRNADAEDHARRLREAKEYAYANILKSQKWQKENYDKRRKDLNFKIGDKVWLNLKNVSTERPMKKLDRRSLGPLRVINKIGEMAYQLELPHGLQIHDTFHVSLLRPHIQRRGERTPSPEPIRVRGDDSRKEYVVQEIVDSRIANKQLLYRVRWKGYTPEEDTWEPSRGLRKAQKLVRKFHHVFPNKPTEKTVHDATLRAGREPPRRGRGRPRKIWALRDKMSR